MGAFRSSAGWMVLLISMLMQWNMVSMAQEIPEVTENDLPGYTLKRNESFNGASLWGYMNGGADIYLEYDFEILRVEEFSVEDEMISLELFKMENPLSAFGIYSMKTFKCSEKDVIASPDCLNPYQFQMAYGDYYIQLVNESASDKAKKAMITIMEALLKKLDKAELHLPSIYLTDSLHFTPDKILLLKGPLGVQNKAQHLTDELKGIEGYQVYVAKTTIDGERITYYEIVFDKAGAKDKFLERFEEVELQLLKEDGNNMLFRLLN